MSAVSKAAPLSVLFAASECVPFIKTGGLADVAGALPKALASLGADVRVVLPKYSAISERLTAGLTHVCEFNLGLGWRSQYCGVETVKLSGVTYYLLDNEYYFAQDYIYGDSSTFEAERFGFFSKAILELMLHTGFFPDVLHLNDWQTGMAAALLKTQYADKPGYGKIRCIFTVHNLKFQGVFPMDFVDELLSLGRDMLNSEHLEYYGAVNYMKGGLSCADAITTVSPTYAREIQTPAYGETLDGLLRERSGRLYGVVNGIDMSIFDPSTDRLIPFTYSECDMSGKEKCKAALLDEMSLSRDGSPLAAMVTRLTGQKGLDLVERVINELIACGVQLAVIGSGEARYEQLLHWAAWRYPGRVNSYIGYNEALAHRAYAGADMLLMPSSFEPCGLSQLIAMRYGTLPVVRETGGLYDTVQPYNKYENTGTGFTFSNYNADELLDAVQRAGGLYRSEPSAWQELRLRAMARDSSWEKPAREYMEIYAKAGR